MSEGKSETDKLVSENEALRRQIAALEADARRFKATLYSIGDAVISADADGDVLQMNPVAEALTGWSEVEAQGRPTAEVFKIVNEESRSEVESPVARVLRDGVVVGLANHSLLIAKDGAERPIADSGAPIRDERGAVIGVVLVFRDQTEERAAQKAIADSEKLFRSLVETMNDGLAMQDAAGLLSYANPRLCDLLGYCKDEIVGKPWKALFDPEGLKILAEQMAKRKAGQTGTYEIPWRTKAGQTIRTLISGNPIHDSAGNLKGSFGVITDITERKRMEEALRESEEKYREVVERANDGIAMIKGRKIVFSNPALARMSGYPLAELDGMEFLRLVPKEQHGLIADRVRRRLAGEQVPANYEIDLLQKDGNIFSVAVSANVLRIHDEPYDLVILHDITERKRLDDQLKQHRDELEQRVRERTAELNRANAYNRSLIEASLDPLVTINPEGKITDVNEATIKVTGLPREGLVGTDFSDYFTEPGKAREGYQQAFAKGFVSDYPLTIRHKDGCLNHVLYNASVYKDAHGNVLGVFAAARDVTKIREFEAALHESEERSRTTLYSIGDGVISTDASGRVARMNPVAELLTGWKEAEALGQPIALVFRIVNEETRAAVENPVEHVLRAGTVVGLANHTVVISKDGTERPVADSGAPIRDEKGEVTGVVLVFRDQTEERAAQRALHDSEQRLAKEMATVTEIVAEMLSGDLANTETERQVLNACLDATGSLYGMVGAINQHGKYDTITYNGRTLGDCAFPEALAWEMSTGMEIRGIWGWPMIHGKSLLCNNPPEHPDRVGQPKGHVPIQCFLAVPIKRDGKVTGMVAVANKPGGYTEVDEQTLTRLVDVMVVSRRHRELLTELEQRVRERTAQLEESNKELEAFSYSVSHDLRAPLRAIDGFTRILVDDYQPHLDTEGKRLCSVIRENTGKMSRLIDDLLGFSRLGRAEMQLSRIDMGAMANAVFYELTTPESRERIDFRVEPLPPAVGDPTLMRQVWTNLLLNAVKFSSKRERAVIKVSALQSEGESVYAVQDDGAGFDMRYAGKLFGVFQRLHSTSEFEGTGVGLALVQRIIRRHGGRVWAEGEPDHGATFYFTLTQKGE